MSLFWGRTAARPEYARRTRSVLTAGKRSCKESRRHRDDLPDEEDRSRQPLADGEEVRPVNPPRRNGGRRRNGNTDDSHGCCLRSLFVDVDVRLLLDDADEQLATGWRHTREVRSAPNESLLYPKCLKIRYQTSFVLEL